jgi:hypothetical protein
MRTTRRLKTNGFIVQNMIRIFLEGIFSLNFNVEVGKGGQHNRRNNIIGSPLGNITVKVTNIYLCSIFGYKCKCHLPLLGVMLSLALLGVLTS